MQHMEADRQAEKPRPIRRRVAAADIGQAEEYLRTAALLFEPEEQSQRQAIKRLLPQIYVLRNRGYSWAQIATMLRECQILLQPATIRGYYHEMLDEKEEAFQARWKEQIEMMAAMRQEASSKGRDDEVRSMAGRVDKLLDRYRSAAHAKIDQKLEASMPAAPSPVETAPAERSSAASRPATQARPAPSPTADATPVVSDFGLLDGAVDAAERRPDAAAPHGKPAGFLGFDEGSQAAVPKTAIPREPLAPKPLPSGARTPRERPAEPSAATPPPSAATAAVRRRCGALQPGIEALKPRANVPKAVYEVGELEHPAIPGLMLTLEQRLYGAALEYFDEEGPEAGVIQMETIDQKRYRVVWRRFVPASPTSTSQSFTAMDTSLFANRPGGSSS